MLDEAKAQRLADLACGRGNFRHALATARSCGDWEWVRDNAPALQEYDEKIEELLKTANSRTIEEARMITSAPI